MLENMIAKEEKIGNWLYLPSRKYDAATNMAIDEFLLERVASTKEKFVRFYEFEKPAVILGYSQNYSDFIGNGVDVTRRGTGGRAIWCDDGVLAYSIISHYSTRYLSKEIHKEYATKIASAIEKLGVKNVKVGDSSAIKVNFETIAGHAQKKIANAFIYHGLLAINAWNVDLISSAITLREVKENGFHIREHEFIKQLPYLKKFIDIEKGEVESAILSSITGNNFINHEFGEIELDKIGEFVKKYMSKNWVVKNGHKSKHGHCFFSPNAFDEKVQRVINGGH